MSRLFLTLGLIFGFVGPAMAQEAPKEPIAGRAHMAWQVVNDIQNTLLSPEQARLLNLLAFHAVATNVCEGLSMDRARISAVFDEILTMDGPDITDEQAAYFRDFLKVNFGIAMGVMLAEQQGKTTGFCHEAVAYRDDPDVRHFFDVEDEAGYQLDDSN